MNTILTANQVTTSLLSNIQNEVVRIMKTIGCDVRSNITVPTVVILNFDEALKQARQEGFMDSVESLKERFDSIQACYNAEEHTIYLKDDTIITASLLAHELVHSCQDASALIEAGKDASDMLRLDTWFEMEAYTIQAIFELDELDKFLVAAKRVGKSPYAFMQESWVTRGKRAVLAQVEHEAFHRQHNSVVAEIQQTGREVDLAIAASKKCYEQRRLEIAQKSLEIKQRVEEAKASYEETRKKLEAFGLEFDAEFEAIRARMRG